MHLGAEKGYLPYSDYSSLRCVVHMDSILSAHEPHVHESMSFCPAVSAGDVPGL